MKHLSRISISVLIAFFLSVGLSYGQHPAEQSLAKGVEYASQGKFEEAREEFEKTLKIDPSYGSARRYLKVIEDVNEGKIQTDTAICFFEGVTHALKDRSAEAITQFNKVIEAEPKYAIPYISRGKAYSARGQYDQAISDFTKAITLNPDDAAVYYFRGDAYGSKGQYDQAICDFTKAIEINPKDAWSYIDRGYIYILKRKYVKAFSDINKAIEINPKFAYAYINRGIACVDTGQYDRAISDFNKAIEINPRNAFAYFNRGSAYGHKGQYDKAISDYTKAIEIDPGNAFAYIDRGFAQANKGQLDKAISDFNKALETDPRHVGAYNNLRFASALKGQYDKAISDYNKAIEINPRNAFAYSHRGFAYANNGQYDKAISDFNKAIEINPRNAFAYNIRGIAYFYKKEHERAWDDFHKARNLGYQIHLEFLKDIGVASGRQIGRTTPTPKKEIFQIQAKSPKGVYLEFRAKMEKCTTLEVFCNLRENYWADPKGYNCEEIQINPDVDSMLRDYILSKGLFPPSKIASIRAEITDNAATLDIKRLDSSHKATIRMVKEGGDWKIETEEIGIDTSSFGAISGIGKALMGKDNLNDLSINLTALMLMEAAREGLTDTVLAYLAEGVFNVNGKASNGSTALMAAAQEGHIDTVLTLLALGADVNIKANDGSTALKKAEERGHEKIFRLLKRAGAKE